MPAKGTRTNDSMQESLKGVLSDIAYMKTMQDADINYLTALEKSILQRLKAPLAQALAKAAQAGAILPPEMMQQAGLSGGQMPGMSGGLGGGLSAMGGQLASPPQGTQGVSRFPGVPPVDELRRLLGSNANA